MIFLSKELVSFSGQNQGSQVLTTVLPPVHFLGVGISECVCFPVEKKELNNCLLQRWNKVFPLHVEILKWKKNSVKVKDKRSTIHTHGKLF